jgi:hypothetical protein
MSENGREGIERDRIGSVHVVQEEDASDTLSWMHHEVFILQ